MFKLNKCQQELWNLQAKADTWEYVPRSITSGNVFYYFIFRTAFKELSSSIGKRTASTQLSGTVSSTPKDVIASLTATKRPPPGVKSRNIKFWTKASFTNWLKDNHSITKLEDGGDKTRKPQSAYIEDADGNRVSEARQAAIFSHARSMWTTLNNAGIAPTSFSAARHDMIDAYVCSMEDKYPELSLCADNWKSEYIWKKNYPSWYESAVGKSNAGSGKRQRSVVDISDDEDEEIHQSKKVATAAKKTTKFGPQPRARKHLKVRLSLHLSYHRTQPNNPRNPVHCT